MTYVQLSQDKRFPISQGKFDDVELLNAYEKEWHDCVHKSAKTDLQTEVHR